MIVNGTLVGRYPYHEKDSKGRLSLNPEKGGNGYLLYCGRWRKVHTVPWGAMIVVEGHYITVSTDNFLGE